MTIRIITEPTIRIIGRMQPDAAAITEWVAASGGPEGWAPDVTTGGGEHLVETATRACYWSYAAPRPGGFKALADRVISEAHGSVLEHAVYTLAVSGVSRALSLELIRHRHVSPSQLSQRYYDESDAAFVVPPAMLGEVREAKRYLARFGEPAPRPVDALGYAHRHADQSGYAELSAEAGAGLRWMAAADQAGRDYSYLADYIAATLPPEMPGTLRRKRAREAARSVLPNCVETRMVLTGNARAWRNVIEQRATEHADREINRFALTVLRLLRADSPNLFGDYAITNLPDGGQVATTRHHKV